MSNSCERSLDPQKGCNRLRSAALQGLGHLQPGLILEDGSDSPQQAVDSPLYPSGGRGWQSRFQRARV